MVALPRSLELDGGCGGVVGGPGGGQSDSAPPLSLARAVVVDSGRANDPVNGPVESRTPWHRSPPEAPQARRPLGVKRLVKQPQRLFFIIIILKTT